MFENYYIGRAYRKSKSPLHIKAWTKNSDGTPAGTVWFAWHIKGQNYTAVMHFAGDCETVLALAVRFALAQLLQLLL